MVSQVLSKEHSPDQPVVVEERSKLNFGERSFQQVDEALDVKECLFVKRQELHSLEYI